MKYFLTFFLLIILTSCNKSKKNISDVLLDGNCFWDKYDSRGDGSVRSGYLFGADGTCYLLDYRFNNSIRTDSVFKRSYSDVQYINRWFYLDNILSLPDRSNELLKVSSDTVFLKTTGYQFFLVRNCKTKIAYENW